MSATDPTDGTPDGRGPAPDAAGPAGHDHPGPAAEAAATGPADGAAADGGGGGAPAGPADPGTTAVVPAPDGASAVTADGSPIQHGPDAPSEHTAVIPAAADGDGGGTPSEHTAVIPAAADGDGGGTPAGDTAVIPAGPGPETAPPTAGDGSAFVGGGGPAWAAPPAGSPAPYPPAAAPGAEHAAEAHGVPHAPHTPHAGWAAPDPTRTFPTAVVPGTPHPGTTHPGAAPHPHAHHSGGYGATPPPSGPGGPGGGAVPPGTPPEAAFGMPAPEPARPSFWQRNKVLGVAAVTALATSLIVGPAAAIITTRLADGGGLDGSSLTGEQASSVSTGSVSTVAESTLPSVVSIETGTGGGSGVVISADGQILTNNHVVAGADTVNVQFNDGTEAEAEVLGADPVSDLAVIQARGVSDLTPAVLGDSDKIEVGADVVAIGSPLGLSGTVTSGVVSAVDRPVNTGSAGEQPQQEQGNPFGLPEERQPQEDGGESGSSGLQTSTVINAIQTDAPINPGNSGGPLMNMNGEVIGINTAILGTGQQAGSIGLGFAIPINQAKPIAEQLIADGQASYAAIDATISEPRQGGGATVVEAHRDGAAAAAGLKEGDLITSIDGEAVDGADALVAAIRSHQPGDTVTLEYERDGKAQEAEVTLSAQSADSMGG
ncbi:S1C family serine protease [Nocardiopsis trehalosi]|uniref:S1C family serine protease n=1 Tax=Nocardiopsis trehalosi TaxID=109329 RepID=UPI000835DDF0|nr:trypsin-like peptidase domain-containing protein [Nocardiopsis trehalosi]